MVASHIQLVINSAAKESILQAIGIRSTVSCSRPSSQPLFLSHPPGHHSRSLILFSVEWRQPVADDRPLTQKEAMRKPHGINTGVKSV